jgi:hypothetical protein
LAYEEQRRIIRSGFFLDEESLKNDPTNSISDKTLPKEFAAPGNRLPDQMLMRKEH